MSDEAGSDHPLDKPPTLQNLIAKHRNSSDTEWHVKDTEEIQFPAEMIKTELLMEATFAEVAFDLDLCMLEVQEADSEDSDSYSITTSETETESDEDSDKENKSRKKNVKNVQPQSGICPICCKSFKHVKRHIETVHKKITRFSCSFCDKKFYDNCQLQSHIKNDHLSVKVIKVKTPDPSKPFKCETCGKFFKSPRTLKQHQNRYHQENNLPGKAIDRSTRICF
jgi:uncharacterized C2H2 Zn-finger protein